MKKQVEALIDFLKKEEKEIMNDINSTRHKTSGLIIKYGKELDKISIQLEVLFLVKYKK